jgi:hypothetical protein
MKSSDFHENKLKNEELNVAYDSDVEWYITDRAVFRHLEMDLAALLDEYQEEQSSIVA